DRREIIMLKQAYDVIFSEGGTIAQNLENVERSIKGVGLVDQVVEFMKMDASRSFCLPKRNS
ncbi:MAG: hypothetical protein LBJ71_05090, partial [Holosporaceae bacterium]|nr:hypothetical protein [Holosporaceae bacterium]